MVFKINSKILFYYIFFTVQGLTFLWGPSDLVTDYSVWILMYRRMEVLGSIGSRPCSSCVSPGTSPLHLCLLVQAFHPSLMDFEARRILTHFPTDASCNHRR